MGDATCCVDVTNKHPGGEGSAPTGAGRLSRSFPQGFFVLMSELSPFGGSQSSEKGEEEHFNARHFSFHPYCSDVNCTSEDKTPPNTSPLLPVSSGFYRFFRIIVGSFVFRLRLTASQTVTVFIITGDFFDLKSCPALKKSFGGYFVLWFAVADQEELREKDYCHSNNGNSDSSTFWMFQTK